MLKALIFDVDGTLADTERDGHRVAFNRAFEVAGLDWHWDIECYGHLLSVTGGKERMRFFAEQYDTDFLKQNNVDTLIAQLHANKTEHYVQLLNEGKIPLRTGVERVINESRDAGLTLAISTTTTPQNVNALIDNTLGKQAMNWFASIGAGDIVEAKKPAPDIYLHVLNELNLAPDECVAFEDSENGVLSSIASSLTTIVTSNEYTLDHDFKGAALVLDQMGEPSQAAQVSVGSLRKSYLDLQGIEEIYAAR